MAHSGGRQADLCEFKKDTKRNPFSKKPPPKKEEKKKEEEERERIIP